MSWEYLSQVAPAILSGVPVATGLFFVTILVSIPLGMLITLLATCRLKPLQWLAKAYIYVIRGTPLLLQLMFIYFGLPYLPGVGKYLVMERLTAAMWGFVLNYAAYFAEIFRGGLLAIDRGQYEACRVLGLSRAQTFVRVIFPQMIRVSLPSVANESVTLVKDTSLLYAVSVPEILHYTRTIVSRDGQPIVFLIAGIIYLVMNLVLTLFFRWVEKRFQF